MGMNLFSEIDRTNAAYCRTLGLDATPYEAKLSPAEVEIAKFVSAGINRRSAEMFAELNGPFVQDRWNPRQPAPTSFHAVVEYARPVSLWDQTDIQPFYDDQRAKHPQLAGCWCGD